MNEKEIKKYCYNNLFGTLAEQEKTAFLNENLILKPVMKYNALRVILT